MTRRAAPVLAALVLLGCGGGRRDGLPRVVVGSKNFTESILLGELLAQKIEAAGIARVERKLDLGGSFVCDKAIRSGEIDLYPEYTGTAHGAILKLPVDTDPQRVRRAVEEAYARDGLRWMPGLGFENTFAMLVRGEDARRLGIKTIGEAAAHAKGWRGGFGYEFESREDGLKGLARTYGLELGSIKTMDLGLTYRALAAGDVDLIAGNSTDGLIAKLDLVQLVDDRHYFPPYEAAAVVREDTLGRVPGLGAALEALAGRFSADDLRAANLAIDGGKRPAAEVAAELLAARGQER